MMKLIDRYMEFFSRQKPLPSGMFSYQAPPDADYPYRLHLRLEENGRGMMVVNAQTVLHLNQTAAECAYYYIQGWSDEQAAAEIEKRYKVSREQALADYKDLADRIHELIRTPDLDPVTYLGFERSTPHTEDHSAPLRLDCALTYHTSRGAKSNAAAQARVKRELTTEEWQTILDKAWKAGIPHVIFTGGEATLRPDLLDLVKYAEKLGQVTGLLTDGERLAEPQFLQELLQSGLDHVMIVLDTSDEQSWEGLRDSLREDLYITVHLTVNALNQHKMEAYLERLAHMGVMSVSISMANQNLLEELEAARQRIADLKMSLVWDLPVPYSELNPVDMELEQVGLETHAEGAGNTWLYVEPDGDVLPSQGVPVVLGNLHTDPWEQIWQKAAAMKVEKQLEKK
jgi:organic radical activating enzyme